MLLKFNLYNSGVRYYYFAHSIEVRHREVNLFDRKNMKGKYDLQVVKDIHVKALLSAYYSNCTPFYQEGGKRKRKAVYRVAQLHKSGVGCSGEGKQDNKSFQNVFKGRGQ